MCYKGGPYCSKTAKNRLQRANNVYVNNRTEENFKARKKAQEDYDGTPEGQETLDNMISRVNSEGQRNSLQLRKDKAMSVRESERERAKAEERQAKLILTHGLPASGKSTWATQQVEGNPDTVRVNRDDLRTELFGYEYHSRDYFSPEDEKKVSEVQQERTEAALSEGKTVILDDTNLRTNVIQNWVKTAESHGLEAEHKYFDVALEELKRRNSSRERVVPEFVMDNMFAKGVRKDGITVKRVFRDKNGDAYNK